MKYLKIGLFFSIFWLFSCGSEKDSDLKIINGHIVKLSHDDDPDEKPHVVGLGFGRRFDGKRYSEGEVCSGFRYGLRYLITSAQCMRKQIRQDGHFSEVDTDYTQYPSPARAKNFPIAFLLMSGTGGVIQVEAQVFFHPAFAQRCAEKLQCPDIAIVELPKETVMADEYNAITNPAKYDPTPGPINSDTVPVAVAGFGCTKSGTGGIDPMNPQNCSRLGEDFWDLTFRGTGFANFSFSIVAGVSMSRPEGQDIKPYYYKLEAPGNNLQLTSGDSGAPIFRFSFSNDQLRPGDPWTFTVDAIGVSLYNSEWKFYGSYALDLGHDDIENWVRQVTKNDLALLDNTVTPAPFPGGAGDSGILKMCNARLLNPETTPDLGVALDLSEAHLGSLFETELKKNLGLINNKGMAQHLANCIAVIRKELKRVRTLANPAQGLGAAEARLSYLEYAEYNALYILECVLEYQNLNAEREAAEILALQAMRQQAEDELFDIMMMVVDVGTDIIPQVAVAKTIFTVATGRSAVPPFEKVGDLEWNLSAATMLLPGVMKATTKGLDYAGTAAKGVGRGARIAAKVLQYQEKVGVLSAKLAKVGQKISQAPEKMAAVFAKASVLGYKTPMAIRKFLTVGKSLYKSCDVIDQFVDNRFAPRSLLPNVLDLLIPTAYASSSDFEECSALAASTIKNIQKRFVKMELETLEELIDVAKKAGLKDARHIEDAIISGAKSERGFKNWVNRSRPKTPEPKILKREKILTQVDQNDPMPGDGEIEALNRMAREGYDIEPLPSTLSNDHGRRTSGRPDLLMDGKPADIYTPKPTTSPRNIAENVLKKSEVQAGTIIVNLRYWNGTDERLMEELRLNILDDVDEIFIMRPDRLEQWFPF